MKKGLIFDLDGTLVDSLPGIAVTLNRCLATHGFPKHSDAAVRTFVGDGLRKLIERATPRQTGPEQTQALVALFKKDYETLWQQGTHPFPGIPDLLHQLQQNGHPLAILSNKPHEVTGTIVRTVFPTIHFQAVLGQQDGTPLKPDPASALRIAGQLGLAPADCILIGDSSIDIQTAANAGMSSIGVDWGYHDRDKLTAAGAKLIAATPTEITATLEAQPDTTA